MTVRYYSTSGQPDYHWGAFFKYSLDRLGLVNDGRGNANQLFKAANSILYEFHGKIIWYNGDDTKYYFQCLEFDTIEDLLYFKLRFN